MTRTLIALLAAVTLMLPATFADAGGKRGRASKAKAPTTRMATKSKKAYKAEKTRKGKKTRKFKKAPKAKLAAPLGTGK